MKQPEDMAASKPFRYVRWWWANRCGHRSHRLHLPCLRWLTYDYQCGKHNRSCFAACETRPWDA